MPNTLLKILERKGISHKWLANEMGINKVTLSKKINGTLRLTEKDKQKIADILHLPLDVVFKEEL